MENRIKAAMAEAVRLGLLPANTTPEEYELNWRRLEAVLEAADCAPGLTISDEPRKQAFVSANDAETRYIQAVAEKRLGRPPDSLSNAWRAMAGLSQCSRAVVGARNGRSSARKRETR